MAVSGGILAAVLGAAGAAAYVLWRKSEDAKGKPPSGAGADPCEGITNPYGYAVCKGAGIVNSFLDGLANWDKAADAKNRELNGAVKVPLAERLKKASICPGTTAGSPTRPAIWGTVVEFENGCQPFDGAPGWSKCKPGTTSMVTANCGSDMKGPALAPTVEARTAAGNVNIYPSASLSGRPGDAFTSGPYVNPTTGEGWSWVLGQEIKCPSGQVADQDSIAFVRDHVTGKTSAIAKCHKPGEPVSFGSAANTYTGTIKPTPPLAGDPGGPHEQVAITDSSHPGFHFVPATPTVPAHWERDMAR